MTKEGGALIERAARFIRTGRWRLVDDPLFTAAKKRIAQGLGDLEEVKPKDLFDELGETAGLLMMSLQNIYELVWK